MERRETAVDLPSRPVRWFWTMLILLVFGLQLALIARTHVLNDDRYGFAMFHEHAGDVDPGSVLASVLRGEAPTPALGTEAADHARSRRRRQACAVCPAASLPRCRN